jgi:hypothetical protein
MIRLTSGQRDMLQLAAVFRSVGQQIAGEELVALVFEQIGLPDEALRTRGSFRDWLEQNDSDSGSAEPPERER